MGGSGEAAARAVPGAAAAMASGAGERRQLTALFADLVDSTMLVDRLDPEDVADVMRGYQRCCEQAIDRYDGFIAKYLGDGIVAYFGYPRAHEDAAARALYAAQDIIEALKVFERECGVAELAARIGVATGMVMVRHAETREGLEVYGACPTLAARLQAAAPRNGIVVSETTRRLAGGLFSFGSLGVLQLKGFQAGVSAFALEGRRRRTSRFAALRLGQATPFVGRTVELAELERHWRATMEGSGRAVLLVGEPGIGKSRLTNALRERLEEGAYVVVRQQCSPYHGSTVLHPITEWLERAAGLGQTQTPVGKTGLLQRVLTDVWETGEEQIELIAGLLDLPMPSGRLPTELPPPVRLQRTLVALRDTFLGKAEHVPVLLVLEDVHWIDPTSTELLRSLIESCPAHQLMILATSRPGAADQWQTGATHLHTLQLERLSDSECATLARSVAANDNLPEALVARIVAKTDGNPLFAEEYASMVLEAAGAEGVAAEEVEVPATLHDLIMDRLDRLPAAKPIVQFGAAIGREFPLNLVAVLLGQTTTELAGPIGTLLDANLLFQSQQGQETLYIFKHALVQDMAYASLPRRQRVRIHNAIAAAYEGPFAHLVQGRSELLGRHLRGAERLIEAARCYLDAGTATIRRGAPQEAIAHFRNGLEAVASLADEAEVLQLRLQLLSALGPTLMIANGPGAPAFGAAQSEALDLCRRLDEEARLFPILYGRALYAWGSGDLRQAALDAAELRARAHTFNDDEHRLASATMSALVSWHVGDAGASFRYLRGVVKRYRPEEHHRLFYTYLMEFGVFGRFYAALSLAVLDRPRAARAVAMSALDLALSLNQPHALGFGRLANFVTATLLGDHATATLHAEACLPFAREQGFPEFVALALICRGAARVAAGEIKIGTHDLEEGTARWRDTGFETWQSWFGALLGNAHLAAGRLDAARAEIDRQLQRIERNGERQFEAPLLKARSRVHAAMGDEEAAAHDLSRSRTVALAQGTRLWLRK